MTSISGLAAPDRVSAAERESHGEVQGLAFLSIEPFTVQTQVLRAKMIPLHSLAGRCFTSGQSFCVANRDFLTPLTFNLQSNEAGEVLPKVENILSWFRFRNADRLYNRIASNRIAREGFQLPFRDRPRVYWAPLRIVMPDGGEM